MYNDHSLLPKEAIRLTALGILAGQPTGYAALAREVRHFISRIVGPSLDLMGSSIELLRFEGLVAADGDHPDAELTITEAGRAELRELLSAAVRPPLNDVNKLVMTLKMRFMHLLEPEARRAQADMMIEACRAELARLIDLRGAHADEPGFLAGWLDHDISLVEARLAWLTDFRARI